MIPPEPVREVRADIAGFVGVVATPQDGALCLRSFDELTKLDVRDDPLLGAVKGFFANGGTLCYVASASADHDDEVDAVERALERLGAIPEISMVAVPGQWRSEVSGRIAAAVVAHCEGRRDRMALLSVPATESDPTLFAAAVRSSFGTLYHPAFEVEAERGRDIPVAPVGHVAGAWARVARERGVHRAPANLVLNGVERLTVPVGETEIEQWNPVGVNSIRDLPAAGGIVIWGARTLDPEGEFRFVSVRRLEIALRTSIERSTGWVVFEGNDESLWAALRGAVGDFLLEHFRRGAFQGRRAEEAFFVRCDRDTMTQEDIDEGRLRCLVGFAPLRPAEFVVFEVRHQLQA